MSESIEKANSAIAKEDFVAAKKLLSAALVSTPGDPYLIQRLALATYKSKQPTPSDALIEAKLILEGLEPSKSADPETLGLWGAIHKRLWEFRHDSSDLETALLAYEKGFCLTNDFYNGINLAFIYDLHSSIATGDDVIADAVLAQRTRKRVLKICDLRLSEGKSVSNDEKFWILATVAEANVGLGNEMLASEALAQAKALEPPAWMISSVEHQIEQLRRIKAHNS